jgi:hypothetical protein
MKIGHGDKLAIWFNPDSKAVLVTKAETVNSPAAYQHARSLQVFR